MVLPLVLVITIVLFIMQLCLCLRGKRSWLRLLPVYLMGGFELLCVFCFFLGKALELELSLSFPAFLLGYIGCYWALALVLAWAVYGIVKIIQKSRK